MDLVVLVAVLGAAACHAGRNARLKLRLEPLLAVSLISITCGIVTVPLLGLVALPAPVAWPYIVASLLLHLVYYVALTEAYRHGDLILVYPLARASAPLLTAAVATIWLGEQLGHGVGRHRHLAAAVLMLSLRRGPNRTRSMPARSALLCSLPPALWSLPVDDGPLGGRIGLEHP
jgi:hypothetical protein